MYEYYSKHKQCLKDKHISNVFEANSVTIVNDIAVEIQSVVFVVGWELSVVTGVGRPPYFLGVELSSDVFVTERGSWECRNITFLIWCV